MKKKNKVLKFFAFIIVICLLGFGGFYVYEKTDIIVPNFEVEFVCDEDVQTNATDITIRKNKTISELPTATKEGYDFVGWFYEGSQFTTETAVSKNLKLTAKFIPKKIDITFVVDGRSYTEKEDYDSIPVFDGDLSKTPTATIAYEFDGWSPELEVVKGSKTYTAKFKAVERKYKINATSNYSRACTIVGDGDDFVYQSSTTLSVTNIMAGYDFIGWFDADSDTLVESDTSFEIDSIEKDSTYVVKFKQNFYSARFVVDDNELEDLWKKTEYTEALLEPVINYDSLHVSGYQIDGWYTDKEMTNKFVFGNCLTSDIVLYGTYKYFLKNGFVDNKEKYDSLKSSETLNINSFDELVEYIEYLLFYSKNAGNNIKLTYKNTSTNSELFEEFNKAAASSALPTYGLRYSAYTGRTSIGRIYVTQSYENEEASLIADSSKQYVYEQQDSAFLMNFSKTRDENYKFPVEYIGKSLSVSTSNQLVYCLEKGLRPVCVPGSKAETIYNKAKTVLREICDDTMSDVQKSRAIYEWLIMNVQYDNYAASNISDGWYKYSSWFAEGVFIDGVAVCDGIAKAYLILAQIENIPTIRVDGNNHAWNKTYLLGEWFGVDATHGNVLVNEEFEVLSYSGFLFSDDYKEDLGFSTTDYDEIVANTSYEIYETMTYKVNNNSFDLLVNSTAELMNIFRYAKSQSHESEYLTLEFAFDSSISSSDANNMITYCVTWSGLNVELSSYGNVNEFGQYIIILYVA